MDAAFLLDVFSRRRWVTACVGVLCSLTVAIAVFAMKPVYQASALLLIEKERGSAGQNIAGAMVESSNEDYYQTQYRLLKSETLLRQVYEKLDLRSTVEFGDPKGVAKLMDAVTISPVLRSRLVYVRAESQDAELSTKIANTIASMFVEQNLSNQLFISKEVLHALKAEGKDARKTYDALPAVVNNPLVQGLRADAVKLQAQAADLSAKLTPKHPTMVALQSNMAALQVQIDRETEKIVQSLRTELSGQLRGNNVRVVDVAQTPDSPIRPRKKRLILLGVVFGILLGLMAAVLIEALDQSIRTQEDVERKLHLPFLGGIPETPINRQEKVHAALLAEELSLTSEAFRNLRTMADFASVETTQGRLLVTSTVQEEGKSYIASNLAVAFAQLGQRVLLIDGDLRRPKLHRNFSLRSDKGVSHFLAGSASTDELPSLVQPTDVPGLSVLPCGTIPPNPSELLNTPRLSALLAWAGSHYDRIIVDCTPMFPINDTLLWARHVRSAIFTVRHGKTRAPFIRNAARKMETSGLRLLGVVVNATTLGSLSYSYGTYSQQYYQQYLATEKSSAK